MHEFLIFLVGVLFGGIVGVVTMGLCNVAKTWDLDKYDLCDKDTKED